MQAGYALRPGKTETSNRPDTLPEHMIFFIHACKTMDTVRQFHISFHKNHLISRSGKRKHCRARVFSQEAKKYSGSSGSSPGKPI
jgi:hypothetical protein